MHGLYFHGSCIPEADSDSCTTLGQQRLKSKKILLSSSLCCWNYQSSGPALTPPQGNSTRWEAWKQMPRLYSQQQKSMILCRAQGGKGAVDTQFELWLYLRSKRLFSLSSSPQCCPGKLCASSRLPGGPIGSWDSRSWQGEAPAPCWKPLLCQGLHSLLLPGFR